MRRNTYGRHECIVLSAYVVAFDPVRIKLFRPRLRRTEPHCVCRGFDEKALDDIDAAYTAKNPASRSSPAMRRA